MRILMIAIAVLGLVAAFAAAVAAHPPLRERVWSDHVEYAIAEAGQPPSPADQPALPYYIIGAIDAAHPQGPAHEGALGAHDHVIPSVPPGNGGTFTPQWRIILVVPGPKAVLDGPEANVLVRFVTPPEPPAGPLPLVYAAVLPGQGTAPHPLQAADEVRQAAELGLVTLVNTGVVFTGPVVAVGHTE